jgi:hypothetical protein
MDRFGLLRVHSIAPFRSTALAEPHLSSRPCVRTVEHNTRATDSDGNAFRIAILLYPSPEKGARLLKKSHHDSSYILSSGVRTTLYSARSTFTLLTILLVAETADNLSAPAVFSLHRHFMESLSADKAVL